MLRQRAIPDIKIPYNNRWLRNGADGGRRACGPYGRSRQKLPSRRFCATAGRFTDAPWFKSYALVKRGVRMFDELEAVGYVERRMAPEDQRERRMAATTLVTNSLARAERAQRH